MTTITLEVPDKLAQEIEPIRRELPMLLAITRQMFRPANEPKAHEASIYLAYKQLLDFFATSPTPQQVARFGISAKAQERVEELLSKHGEGQLSDEEVAELHVYAQINDVIGFKKAEAALAMSVRH